MKKKNDKNDNINKKKFKIDLKALLKKPLFYVSFIQILFSILLIFTVIKIGVLGVKFLIPIILSICVVDFLVLFFLYKRKGKKTKIALSILSVLLSIAYLIISIVLLQVYSSMNNMFKNNSYINYSVLALKSSNYKKINDIDDKIIGYYVDDKYNESAQKELNKKVDVEYIGYSSINELKNALLVKEIDALMIMDSYLEIDDVSEEESIADIQDNNSSNHLVSEDEKNMLDNIEDFDVKSKTIYNFKIKVDNSKKSKKIDLEKGSFAIYVSGQDSYADSVSETSRSDVNLLMIVNLKSKQILLLSIPRDYYINISSKGAYDKLTHISLYGSEEAMSSLGDLLDVSVDYYVKFNFTTFMKAVEYLLPLDVYSDYDFTTSVYDQTIGNSYTFSKGYNHITDGKMALQFVRARKNFAEGDRQRGINQSRFLRAVINKASTPSVLLKYNKILKSLEGTFLTNISNESIQEIAKYVLNNNGKFEISSISLDGSDANRPTYSGGSQPLYVMIPDNKTIEDAKVQIKTVLDGGRPDIEQDASELANVKDTHSVPSKDIGKTYSSVPTYRPSNVQNSNYNNIQNEVLNENNDKVIKDEVDDKNNPNQSDKTDDSDDSNQDKDSDKNPTPSPTPSPSPNPPGGDGSSTGEDKGESKEPDE